MKGMGHKPSARALQRIRALSHVLDNAIAIPGTKLRFGLDPLLGLFPGAGDWVSAVLSVYIVLESLRFRLPRPVLTQMLSNLILDMAAGSVPVLGDVFDVTWKANHRNVKLLEASLQDPTPPPPANRLFVGLVVLALLGILAIVSLTVFFVLRTALQVVQGAG